MPSATTTSSKRLKAHSKPDGPPIRPDNPSEASLRRHCQDFAKWLLLSNPNDSSRIGVASKEIPTKTFKEPAIKLEIKDANEIKNNAGLSNGDKKRKPRQTDDGAGVWMRAAISAALSGFVNYNDAIETFHQLSKNKPDESSDEDSSDAESSLNILKYQVPADLEVEHESDATILVLFSAGLHTLAQRKLAHSDSFSLQILQDKLTMKRKMPIPVLSHLCLFYQKMGWVVLESDATKMHSGTKFKRTKKIPEELDSSQLAEIATSL